MSRRRCRRGDSRLVAFLKATWKGDRIRLFDYGGVVVGVKYSWKGYPIGIHCVPYVLEPDPWPLLNRIEGEMCRMLTKQSCASRVTAGSRSMSDPAAVDETPLLWGYLTQSVWEDGTPRATSSLLLFEQDGFLKLMLRDRENGLCLWVAAPNLSSAFAAVELALSDPTTEWRLDRQAGNDQAKRVKPTGPSRKK